MSAVPRKRPNGAGAEAESAVHNNLLINWRHDLAQSGFICSSHRTKATAAEPSLRYGAFQGYDRGRRLQRLERRHRLFMAGGVAAICCALRG
jgi:hypothetical protein